MKFDRHETDLYILPETDEETKKVLEYIRANNIGYEWSRSNVESQDWYGSRFFEIPFGEHHKENIEKL